MTGAEPAIVHEGDCAGSHDANASCHRINLGALLGKHAADTQDHIYVEGGFVPTYPTLPLDAGVGALADFAQECWIRHLQHQRDVVLRQHATNEAIRKLDLAEQALRRLTDARGLNKEVAVALAAVQSARELL